MDVLGIFDCLNLGDSTYRVIVIELQTSAIHNPIQQRKCGISESDHAPSTRPPFWDEWTANTAQVLALLPPMNGFV